MALTEKLTNIADAIREKTGKEDLLTLEAMAAEISGIETGGGGDDDNFTKYIQRTGTEYIIPNGCEKIGIYAFYTYTKLTSIQMPETIKIIDASAFYSCVNLELDKLPNNITELGNSAFCDCKAITIKQIPSKVKYIYMNCFKNCVGLTEITFNNKPNVLASNVFDGCSNLTTINVPWSEGEVYGAPWGATNATIVYNHTGE